MRHRALVAATVAAALLIAVAGALMQSLTRNPFADPGLLGINAGASLAVVIALTAGLGGGFAAQVPVAFLGAGIAAIVIYAIGARGAAAGAPVRLALAGVALTALITSITYAVLLLDEATLEQYRLWVAGSLTGRQSEDVTALIPIVVVGIAVALVLAACSSGSAAEDSNAEPTATAEETASAAFPVTLDTVMGDVVVEDEPERVVTLGSHEHEYLYALGVAPVAVPVSWQGYDMGTGPWAEGDRIAAGAEPETFKPGTTTYDAEAIAAFEPDLIVATYPNHTMTDEEFQLLSGIAPVVTRPATDSDGNETVEWGVSLADELTLLAQATGTTDKAEEIIAEIDAAYAGVRDAHPEWEGKTSQVGGFYEGQAFVYAASDTRNQFLANLGLDVTSIDNTDSAWLQISAEQLDVLGELDSVVWQVATTPEAKDDLESLPLFDSLRTSEIGGNIWLADPVLEGAFFANSPSSVHYALERFVPMLEAALDGDPDTEVPASTDAR